MNNQKSAAGGLAALLKKNGQARQYYASLPSYVQDLIGLRIRSAPLCRQHSIQPVEVGPSVLPLFYLYISFRNSLSILCIFCCGGFPIILIRRYSIHE